MGMKIHVRAPARLHLGVIDLSGSLGRLYGSIGVAINKPSVEVLAEKSDEIEVIYGIGVERFNSRKIIKRVLESYGIEGGVNLSIIKSIPSHVGLGSTTQLSLSIAMAVSWLYGINASVKELANLLGRGGVSGIGTAAFERGGFIVDGGVDIKRKSIPPLIFHQVFPESWFFVIATPDVKRGLTEKAEAEVFRKAGASPEYARKICHLVIMKLLPALLEQDIDEFGSALTMIQKNVGAAFSPYQEGMFHSRATEDIIEFMLRIGAKGAGQSSWGPSAYAVVEGEQSAVGLKNKVRKFMHEEYGGTAFYTGANNLGAAVKFLGR